MLVPVKDSVTASVMIVPPKDSDMFYACPAMLLVFDGEHPTLHSIYETQDGLTQQLGGLGIVKQIF